VPKPSGLRTNCCCLSYLSVDTVCGTIARMRTFCGVTALMILAVIPLRAADPKDPLDRARALYNERQFEAALAAAEEGGRVAARQDSADLIAARAYLERFRESAAPEDLASARDRLRRLNPERLSARERVEF